MSAGQPRKYLPQPLEDKFFEYIEYCATNNRFANIDGFCIFASMNPDTWYNYKTNSNIKAEYTETIKRIEASLLDFTMQKGFETKNPAFIIFYLKNKFNWRDKQEIETTGTMDLNNKVDLTGFSVDQLKDMLKD